MKNGELYNFIIFPVLLTFHFVISISICNFINSADSDFIRPPAIFPLNSFCIIFIFSCRLFHSNLLRWGRTVRMSAALLTYFLSSFVNMSRETRPCNGVKSLKFVTNVYNYHFKVPTLLHYLKYGLLLFYLRFVVSHEKNK